MIIDERGYFELKNSDKEYNFTGSFVINNNGEIYLISDDEKEPPANLSFVDLGEATITGRLLETGRYIFLSKIYRCLEDFSPLRYRYISEYCVISQSRIENNIFKSIDLPMGNLDNWHTPGNVSLEGDRKTSMTFKAAVHDDHSWTFGDIELKLINFIGHKVNYNFSHSNFSAETQSVFNISLNTEKPLEEFLRLSRKLEELISLLVNGFYSFEKRLIRWEQSGKLCKGEIFFKEKINKSHIPIAEMMVTFDKISINFGDIFNNWLQKSEELGPGIHLYTGTQRNKGLYIEHQFASLVWGLESIDRRINKEDEAPQTQDYQTKLKYYLEKIFAKEGGKYKLDLNRRERRRIENILAGSFSITLSDRLYNLLKPICISIDDVRLKTFCDKIANLRNNLSHEGGIKKNGDYSSFINDLSKYKPALMELYGLVLLKILGVSEDIIESHLFNGRRINHMVHKLYIAELISVADFEDIKQNAYRNKQ